MIFTSQTFIFFFFPICLILYFLSEKLERFKIFAQTRIKDVILIVFSLVFFAWSGFIDALRLISLVCVVYCFGKILMRLRNEVDFVNPHKDGRKLSEKTRIEKVVMITGVVFMLAYLVFFKYIAIADFNGFKMSTDLVGFAPLLGVSFIIFGAISYVVDVYRGHADGDSFIDCALYMTFFAKIISGPIMLWKNFSKQIKDRKINLDKAYSGIVRIMIGFAKKLILADTFGKVLADIGTGGIDQITAFGVVILYFLQIYYDFAGYSDVAIGLCRIFGFESEENFNFPYRSTSITIFWRKWHISLGAFFREYVYFPLGGSRNGKKTTLFNLAVVFALTGVWHGTGLNYLLWGAINAVCVIVERLIMNTSFYKKTPSIIKWLATMVIVALFWQLFRFDLPKFGEFMGTLFGFIKSDSINYTWQYYFDKQTIAFAIIGLLGATVLGNEKIIALNNKFYATKVGYTIENVLLIILFALAIIFMVNSDFSPFIYFQY